MTRECEGVKNATYFILTSSKASSGAPTELIFVSFWLKSVSLVLLSIYRQSPAFEIDRTKKIKNQIVNFWVSFYFTSRN